METGSQLGLAALLLLGSRVGGPRVSLAHSSLVDFRHRAGIECSELVGTWLSSLDVVA